MKPSFLRAHLFAVALSALILFSGGLLQAAAPGFFKLGQIDGRWWFLDPNGELFLSKGVTTVLFYQDCVQGTIISPYGITNLEKYGTVGKWRKAVAQRLFNWNFNTLGAWSDEAISRVDAGGGRHLAYSVTIDFVAEFAAHNHQPDSWQRGIFPDIFAPDFPKFCNERARKMCAPRKLDAHLLGWFTDNELRWGPDWRGKEEVLTLFLNLPAGQAGRTAAIGLLRKRYPDFAAFNAVWKTRAESWEELASVPIDAPFTRAQALAQNQEVERDAAGAGKAFVADCDAFLADLAELYFTTTDAAIKAADPNHLNFGCRFAYMPAQTVVAAAARHLDVISFNCYNADPSYAIDSYSAFGKPVLIGEFSFRAMDSGLPNTKGAGPKVPTQNDRAAAFEKYVTLALSKPNLVGYHWFEHADEPKEGRFDGENSNYGVVDIHDNPYEELTRKMTEINRKAEALHRGGNP